MSETSETKQPVESNQPQTTKPIVEEPTNNNNKPVEEHNITEVINEAPTIKETIEIIPADLPLSISKNVQASEQTDKRIDQTSTQMLTEENKVKEKSAEMVVNDESFKVETKSTQTVMEDKSHEPGDASKEKVVTRKSARGRVTRTAKAADMTSTETIEVVEEKKPVEENITRAIIEKEQPQAIEAPKRGRGRQPKRKADTFPAKRGKTRKTS